MVLSYNFVLSPVQSYKYSEIVGFWTTSSTATTTVTSGRSYNNTIYIFAWFFSKLHPILTSRIFWNHLGVVPLLS